MIDVHDEDEDEDEEEEEEEQEMLLAAGYQPHLLQHSNRRSVVKVSNVALQPVQKWTAIQKVSNHGEITGVSGSETEPHFSSNTI